MARKITHMSLEGGVLFFEDGTEVSGVSVEMIKAMPDLLAALRQVVMDFQTIDSCYPEEPGIELAKAAILKATGETV
jgi:hypothetical protein